MGFLQIQSQMTTDMPRGVDNVLSTFKNAYIDSTLYAFVLKVCIIHVFGASTVCSAQMLHRLVRVRVILKLAN